MAAAATASPAVPTWKESAGREDGAVGYKFGDLTRGFMKRGSESLQRGYANLVSWSSAPKTTEGYEFGDLFLKELVMTISGQALPKTEADSDDDETEAQESAAHKEIANAMNDTRKQALDLFKEHLPTLELQVQTLEAKKTSGGLDVVDESKLFRLKFTMSEDGAGQTLTRVDKWKNDFEEIKSTTNVVVTASFVRIAESCGELAKLQSTFEQALKRAEDCAQCAHDVCEASETEASA